MNLITLTDPQSAAAEAYRSLRTNLYFASLDAPAKTIVVTSPAAGEARTSVMANLAVVMAQTGKKVIAVEADLRHPSLHEYFGMKNERGLGDVLSEDDDPVQIPLYTADIRGLSVLPGGAVHSAPLDLLSSSRMTDVIAKLTDMADVVLFNAAPMLDVSDTAMLASKTDGVLLVVQMGKTRRADAQQAKDILTRAHARLIGVVTLNTSRSRGLGLAGY
ncbi:MAG: CpsD/CapB family tyrosine-protein kinase [Chloroflexi bacterium]|nr:CpsD/CapB family tyrosine-protein kinase [Chloroflexota bacterium]MCL5273675.1 CpsD/CapB family tyrosine-protein kinase [Chloroflexota bacterium]